MVVRPALETTADDLLGVIPGAQALIVRSATQVTADVLEVGRDLVVVGRAGTGVDNVDTAAATARAAEAGTRGGRAAGRERAARGVAERLDRPGCGGDEQHRHRRRERRIANPRRGAKRQHRSRRHTGDDQHGREPPQGHGPYRREHPRAAHPCRLQLGGHQPVQPAGDRAMRERPQLGDVRQEDQCQGATEPRAVRREQRDRQPGQEPGPVPAPARPFRHFARPTSCCAASFPLTRSDRRGHVYRAGGPAPAQSLRGAPKCCC